MCKRLGEASVNKTRSLVLQVAHSLVETKYVSRWEEYSGICGPWVYGKALDYWLQDSVENALYCFREWMGEALNLISLLAGNLSSATACSSCGFLHPSFQHWYQKMSFYNIFLAEIKLNVVSNRKYHFCLVYQVILLWCRWPDNMDHISIRKIKTNQQTW